MRAFMRSTVLASPLALALACTHAEADRSYGAGEARQEQADRGVVAGRLREVTPETVTIAADDGNERTLRVNPPTAVVIDGKAAAIGDLEPGQDVRARFDVGPDGRRTAVRIAAGKDADAAMSTGADVPPDTAGPGRQGVQGAGGQPTMNPPEERQQRR